MLHALRTVLLLALLTPLAACGGDSNGGLADADGVSDTADTGGSAGGPILERTPSIAAECAVTAPLTQVAGASWDALSLARTASHTWLAYGGWGRAGRAGYQAAVAPLAADGTLGTPLALAPGSSLGESVHLAALPEDRLAVSFNVGEFQSTTARFAVANTDGSFVVAPRDAPATGALAPLAGGGVAMVTTNVSGGGTGSLRLRILDAAGEVTAGPVDVATAPGTFAAFDAAVVAVAGGVAVAWNEREPTSIHVAWFDATGAALRAPVAIPGELGAGSFVPTGLTLHDVAGTLWLAWSEVDYGTDFAGGTAIIRVAAIAADGTVRHAPVAAPVVDVFRAHPRLVERDGLPGLAWSEGTFIYICGGCITDYDVSFVLLDRDGAGDIVPASAVATIPHDNNGIATRFLAPVGDDIVVVTALDFHALSYPAVATLTCTDSP